MDFLELARARFSVLDYEPRPVEPEKIDRILQAGLAAPTACNLQPQRVLLIDGDAGRQKLRRVAPGRSYVPAAFLICYDRRECWTRPMDGKSSGEIDASIAATHMMLEAWEQGVGSCWVGYFNAQEVAKVLGLPENVTVSALLPMGYPAENAQPLPLHSRFRPTTEIVEEI